MLYNIGVISNDPDTTGIVTMSTGVSTGRPAPLAPSGAFELKTEEQRAGTYNELRSAESNWASAEAEPAIVATLVEKEVSKNWVEELPEDESTWESEFPDGVVFSKLSLALRDGSDPRLCMDSTWPGVNAKHAMPEIVRTPGVPDLAATLPKPSHKDRIKSLLADISGAHKLIPVRRREQGLLAFRHGRKKYHYKVCHFGGGFSAFWWGRLGGFLLRFLHLLIYANHAGLMFGDDFIFDFILEASPLHACLVLLAMIGLGVPHLLEEGESGTGVLVDGPLGQLGSPYHHPH